MSGYKVAGLDEIEGVDYRQQTRMRPVRHHLGITAFGTNAWTAEKVGDRLFPEHEEDEGNEELYVVVRGRARFELGEDTVDAPAGTLVFVSPETTRTAFAEEAGTAVLAVGATRGKPYEPSGWEIWAPAHHLYEAGDYAGAVERAREVVDANPEYAAPTYNLACCEALAGMSKDSIGHLRTAIEMRPSFRDLAKEDTDFDPIRDEPGFRELVRN
jgi:mannose-6-phosphate isomerase-like protein (cupin superfamily)